MKPRYLLFVGRAIATVWAGFWAWFIILELASERFPLEGLIHGGIPLCLAVIATVIAWRWSRPGGLLLLIEGLALACLMGSGYLHPRSPSAALFLFLALAAPPIMSGLLILDGWWRDRRPLATA